MAITINGSGTITGVSAGGLPDGCVDNDTIADSTIANTKLVNDSVTVNGTSIDLGASQTITAGKILQVVQVTDDSQSTYSVGQGNWATLLQASITPSSTSSKVLVMASIALGTDDGWATFCRILQNDSTVGDHLGITSDSRIPITFATVPYSSNNDEISTASYSGVFSPSSTSAVTYKIQGSNRSDSSWAYNRAGDGTNNASRGNATSSIILMEISG